MSRLQQLFQNKQERVLNVYCTAGYPQLESTEEVIASLEKHGADIIELGMPYSDPLADGEVIQGSSAVALHNGMTIQTLFEQLACLHTVPNIPIILMGYMNPVLQFGFEKFCATASEVGVDGLIIPDLPMYEFETEYGRIIKKYDLDFIFLVTPETSEERVRKIDTLASGFIYAVSSSSTTGNTKDINEQQGYFQRLHDMKLKNPILVGFGIKDKATFNAACAFTNGAIIGSAYINALSTGGDIDTVTKDFLNAVKG
jgi:tryptophan synthase alpha chain